MERIGRMMYVMMSLRWKQLLARRSVTKVIRLEWIPLSIKICNQECEFVVWEWIHGNGNTNGIGIRNKHPFKSGLAPLEGVIINLTWTIINQKSQKLRWLGCVSLAKRWVCLTFVLWVRLVYPVAQDLRICDGTQSALRAPMSSLLILAPHEQLTPAHTRARSHRVWLREGRGGTEEGRDRPCAGSFWIEAATTAAQRGIQDSPIKASAGEKVWLILQYGIHTDSQMKRHAECPFENALKKSSSLVSAPWCIWYLMSEQRLITLK